MRRARIAAAAFASLCVVLLQPALWSQGQQRAVAIENVTVIAGGVRLPGFSAVDELILFAEAGLKPLDVLQAGTLNPALLLKQEKSLGTVTAGKLADLLLLDGDPLADMQNLRRVTAVLADGKVFEAAERQALLDAVVQDARKSN